MALTQIDRELIEKCLASRPHAWRSFVDRFVGLFVHTIRHTAECRSFPLNQADLDEICSEIMTQIVANDFRILRNFHGKSSLAAYLAVIARRVAVREFIARSKQPASGAAEATSDPGQDSQVERLANSDQLEHLIGSLSDNEACVVRAYHLEGKSYQEISDQYGIAENSIGPILSRAREYMRRSGLHT